VSKFYLLIWLGWVLRLTLSSVVSAGVFASFITAYIYVSQGSSPLSKEVYEALFHVFKFWFPLVWSVTLLISLFRTLKTVFNRCINGYEMNLKSCSVVGYGDIKGVWRKWLMLIIWLVGAQMIIALIFTKLFTSYEATFDWFNIYVLYTFVLVAGYVSFVLLSSRCRLVSVKKC